MREDDERLRWALVSAARLAGHYLQRHAFDQGRLEWKGPDDPVTTRDKEAERIIKEHLEREAPGNYLGEELGREDRGRRRTYLIDPIDGTKSWILRDFLCSVSIGLEEDGQPAGGVVHDFMKDITYVGLHERRHIEYRAERHPFHKHPLDKVRLAIENAPELHESLRRAGYHTFERSGSTALAMAELAAGNYDGLLRKSTGRGNIWDVAAGDYLLDPKRFFKLDWKGDAFDYRNPRNGMLFLRRDIADKVLEDLGRPERSVIPASQYDPGSPCIPKHQRTGDHRLRSDDDAHYGDSDIERLFSR